MKATKIWVFIVLLLIPAVNAHAWPIPDTGQTKCYNNNDEIPCPTIGEAFYGQDGNYNINPPSYTKLDATGTALPDDAASWTMIRDNVTGLIWENKTNDGTIHDGSNTFTWCDTNPATNGGNQGTCDTGTDAAPTDSEAFIKALNDVKFGGFTDWRMPTEKELQSIVDFSRWSPAIDTNFFSGTVSDDYWSSTTYADGTDAAWPVGFAIGYFASRNKSNSCYVRAVRAGQAGSLDDLVINGDETVTDKATGLMWQQGTSPSTLTWETALTYTEGLSLAGYDDWRMPTEKELQSIVDFSRWSPAIDPSFFSGMVSYVYWSSTTYAYLPSEAWLVNFDGGYPGIFNKSNSYYVRAVRAGQPRLSGHLFINVPAQADRWNIGEQKTLTWDTAGIAGNVKISLSRQGGKSGTFETIIESTENDGSFDWTVTGPDSVNCVLKIEPLNDPSKATSQGLFSISGGTAVINPDPNTINAPWTLTGPGSFSQTGTGDQTLTSLAPGDYTLTWGDVSGWTKPSPASSTQTLVAGWTITFSGTYVHQTIPVIQVTPLSLNFNYVPVGSTKDLFLTVKNTGGGTLTGNTTTTAPFSIVSGGSHSLGTDQSQVVTIRYQPTSQGKHTGTVVFTGGDGAIVPVTGKTEKPLGLPWLLLLLGN